VVTFAPACAVMNMASTSSSTGRNLKAFWFRASFINACSRKDIFSTIKTTSRNKAGGRGYQTRMAAVLAEHAK
jgi:hypothetical protein